MKCNLIMLLIIFVSGCFGGIPVEKTGLEGKTMPSFDVLLMDSATKINTQNISNEGPIVIVYFSPTCPYCRAQMQDMIDNIKSLQRIKFYLLSNYSFNLIKSFYNHYQLKNYPNIIVGQDYTISFYNYFNATAVPYIAIYKADKKLKQVLIGKVGTNVIKDIALN